MILARTEETMNITKYGEWNELKIQHHEIWYNITLAWSRSRARTELILININAIHNNVFVMSYFIQHFPTHFSNCGIFIPCEDATHAICNAN